MGRSPDAGATEAPSVAIEDRDREEGVSDAETEANGVRLYYEIHGGGEPLVLVHGSWVDATRWRFVVPGLAESFRVLVYDRRGHSRSERPDAPGTGVR